MVRLRLPVSRIHLVSCLGLALAGCASEVNPIREMMLSNGIATPVREAPDFIASTRPEVLDYVPVGQPTAVRATPPKTQEEIAVMEMELQRAQALNSARGNAARRAGIGPSPEPVTVPPMPALPDVAPPPARN